MCYVIIYFRLLVRFRYDAATSITNLGVKFGAELDDVVGLLEVAKELDLNVLGASFHVGSGCSEPPVFSRAIEAARSVFDVAKNLGFNFSLLDIGGGFPGNTGTSIQEVCDYEKNVK
jgi:ornithine decarboxylase